MAKVKENPNKRIAAFEHLHSIKIGKHDYNDTDLEKKFSFDSIILLKQVFQTEYSITRTKGGLPRVPARSEDKQLLITSLEDYFHDLREKILEKKHKDGNSVSLRENIDALQQLKLLIDHFEDSNETFPYHMFADYLDNKEYIKSSGDVSKQMREFQFTKSQNERIRNLLRQFSLIYLKDKKINQFDVRDPGVNPNRFQEFMKDKDISKIPPILRELLLLLDGKHSVISSENERVRDELYDPSVVYEQLERLLEEMDKDTQKGGAKPFIDKVKGTKGLDEQVVATVDNILEKYKVLRDAHENVILRKDQDYNMLEGVTTKKILDLESNLTEANDKLTTEVAENAALVAQIATLEGQLSQKDRDIKEKNDQIIELTKQLKVANDNLTRALKNKDYSESEVSRFQGLLGDQVKSITTQLQEAQQQVANLDGERGELQAQLGPLTTQLTDATAKKEVAEASVRRLTAELGQAKITSMTKDYPLKTLTADKTRLQMDLSGSRDLVLQKDSEIENLKGVIGTKDEEISKKQRGIDKLNTIRNEMELLMKSKETDFKILQQGYNTLLSEKGRIERELTTARGLDKVAAETAKRNLERQLQGVRDALESSNQGNDAAIESLGNRVNQLERELNSLQDTHEALLRTQQESAEELATKEGDLARLRAELNALRNQKESERAALQGIIDRLTPEVQTKTSRVTQLEGELATARRTSEARINQLEGELDAATRRTGSSGERSSLLESQLDSARREADALQEALSSQIANLSSEKVEINLNLTEARGQLEALRGEKSRTQGEIDRLTPRVAELESEIASLRAGVLTQKNNYEAQLRAVNEAKDSLEREHDRLLAENRTTAETHTRLTKSLSDALANVTTFTTQRDTALAENQRLTGLLSIKEGELTQANLALQGLTAQREQLVQQNTQLTSLNASLTTKNQELQVVVDAARAKDTEIQALKNRIIALETQLQQDTERIREEARRQMNTGHQTHQTEVARNIEELRLKNEELNTAIRERETLRKSYDSLSESITKLNDDIQHYKGLVDDYKQMVEDQTTTINIYKGIKTPTSNQLVARPISTPMSDVQRVINEETQRALQRRGESTNTALRRLPTATVEPIYPKSRGGAKEEREEDTLLSYCDKIADDSLKDFLLDTPLPFFSLIQDFEKDSKMDIVKSINEEYILKLFIQHHLKTHFESKEMKEFYFHAKELLAKENCFEYAKMFFVLQEIINTVRSDKRKIDILRVKSKEFNSSFDYLNFKIESHEYDFYNAARKEFPLEKQFNLTFKNNIFIRLTNKDDHVYDFNKDLTITVSNYNYKEDIYFINSSMVYFFFILSTHFYLQSENIIDLDDYKKIDNNIEKTVRKLKRSKNKEKRSIQQLMKERKDFIKEE